MILQAHRSAAVAKAFASSATFAQIEAVDWPAHPQNVFRNGPFTMGNRRDVSVLQRVVGLGAFDDEDGGFSTDRHHGGH